MLLSDTHVPQRAKALPDQLWRAIEAADVVIHAGDWNDVPIYDTIRDRSARLIGVAGNNDGVELHERMPLVAIETIEGVRLRVVHETGVPTGREKRMDAAHPDTDLLVFGHSHIPWDSVAPSGMRLLNPGSPTDRRRQPTGTFMTLTLGDGAIGDLTLVPVG